MNIQISIEGKLYHDKLFKLSWSSDAKWVWVHYHNGQTKSWYKRPGRSYRFQRWVKRKGTDSFQNLANFKSPQVVLYFVSSFFSISRKVVSLSVDHVAITQSPLSIHESAVPSAPELLPKGDHVVSHLENNCHFAAPICEFNEFSLPSHPIQMPQSVECDWPTTAWAEEWSVLDAQGQQQKINELIQSL